ncbi:DNA repair metallo-beta-lactamase-domain-containing protein [Cladochytrium replicatum]|nr:DNA repair metallo-beta-lactamase-domain-containing protein [Cladochytrium replicatum]
MESRRCSNVPLERSGFESEDVRDRARKRKSEDESSDTDCTITKRLRDDVAEGEEETNEPNKWAITNSTMGVDYEEFEDIDNYSGYQIDYLNYDWENTYEDDCFPPASVNLIEPTEVSPPRKENQFLSKDSDIDGTAGASENETGVCSETHTCPVCLANLAGFSIQVTEAHVNRCLDHGFTNPTPGTITEPKPDIPEPSKLKPSLIFPSAARPLPYTTQQSITTFFSRSHSACSLSRTSDTTAAYQPLQRFNSIAESKFKEPPNTPLTSGSSKFALPIHSPAPRGGRRGWWGRGRQRFGGKPSKESDGSNDTLIDEQPLEDVSSYVHGNFSKPRPCPWYKRLPGTTFTVDAFAYGKVDNCSGYFLSHFHTDHFGGLTSKFDHGPIYCSAITGSLVIQQLRVKPEYVVRLPMNVPTEVQGVRVTLVDANHCPGAVLFLFEVPNTVVNKGAASATSGSTETSSRVLRYLHTGDFRACPDHLKHPAIARKRIDLLYLDTTYCKPSHCFPPQGEIIDSISELAYRLAVKGESLQEITSTLVATRKKSKVEPVQGKAVSFMYKFLGITQQSVDGRSDSENLEPWKSTSIRKVKWRTLFVVGAYQIGKEKVYKGIAKAIGGKIYVEPYKKRMLMCLDDIELSKLLTTNPNEADIHVVGMGKLNKEALTEKLKALPPVYKQVVAFRPTGWTFRGPKTDAKERSAPSVDSYGADSQLKPFSEKMMKYPESFSTASTGTAYTVKSMRPTLLTTTHVDGIPPMAVIGVPYSEHSSFTELCDFVVGLAGVQRIIPTVNVGNADYRAEMERHFADWERERMSRN